MILPRVGNKALGRDLGDLLSRARPSRLVDKVAPGQRIAPAPAPGAVAAPATGDALAPSEPASESAGPPPFDAPGIASTIPLPESPLEDGDRVFPASAEAMRPEPATGVVAGTASGEGMRPFPASPVCPPAVVWGRVSVGWGVTCFLLDAVLLAGAVGLVRWAPWSPGVSTAAAAGLALAGCLFALAGVACLRYRPVRVPRIGEGGARIRVQLKQ